MKVKRVFTTDVYRKWFDKLTDERASMIIDIRVKRLTEGNPGFIKTFGPVAEIKIDYGPGYRVYYADTGKEIIILLCGGNKKTQDEDMKRASTLAAECKKGVDHDLKEIS